MKRPFLFVFLSLFLIAAKAEPLRVFIRGGEKNRGNEIHAHPRFLAEWTKLLTERGLKIEGGNDWPSTEQITRTDVIVAYAQDGGDATPEQEKRITAFTKRGGGLVIIHTAAVSFTNPAWWRDTIGGAWVPRQTKWKEGPMDLYYSENQRLGGGHPITRNASNFHLDDEIYYDMDLLPAARVLAMSYTPKVKEGKKEAGGQPHIYDIQTQMWTYEKDKYRAFVSIPGHKFATFELPQYRTILLRGIAWAGKRDNLDEFVKKEELEALLYPAGGPQRPEQTLSNLEVHPDFTMKLVAAEPLINKPMNFDWDPAGRLWVAETPEYPNGRRGMRPDYRGKEWKDHGGIDPEPGEQKRPGQDKISILTDTDGDGVMDKKEIFYEGLDLVTGFVFYKDGVIATQAPDILFIRDTDGDGKADKVEKLYTGLGTRDTHAVINNPRWGWDGWIYATHGYSASSTVTNAKGETQGTIGSGVVRFRPDGSKIEQYSSKGGNTWGLTITGDNRVMWTQPTSGQLLMQTVLPEYALARGKMGNTTSYKVVEPSPKSYPAMSWEQLAYVQIDWVGSFTAAAGCAIYDGGTWPEEYNGDYFTTEPTINVIHHTRLTPEGSSYKAAKLPGREETEFVRSKDMWWRPIEVRVGPDGAMYVADFYNQAVIHNDTRGPDHNEVNAAVRPDRDHYFGRIWKIDHKQAKKIAVPDLAKAAVSELAKALESPNKAVRMNAARLLLERPNRLPERTHLWVEGEQEKYAEMMEKNFGYQSLRKLALDTTKPAESRVAALWILGQQDSVLMLDGSKLLTDKDPIVRRNALNLAELPVYSFGQGEGITLNFITNANDGKTVGALAAESDAQVRIAALRALAITIVPSAAKHEMAQGISANIAQAIVAAWPKFDDDFQRSAAVGAASRNPVAVISAALQVAKDDSFTPLIVAVTQNVSEADIAAKMVLALADKPADADPLKRTVLETLGKSLKTAPEISPELSTALGKLLASGVGNSALPLAAKWDKSGTLKEQVGKQFMALVASANDAKASEENRLAAAHSLLGVSGVIPDATEAVTGLLGGGTSPGFQRNLVLALGESDQQIVGTKLADAWNHLPTEAQTAVFDTVLKRADWSHAFLDAVKAKTVDVTTLGPANSYRLRTHQNKKVAERAERLLDELNPTAKLKKDAIAKLAPIVEQKGDAAKGKALFQVTCATCHKFGDFGAEIGPGLTGMGSHGASELLSAIVDPNAEVDPSFLAWNLETKDGQLFNGVIESENPTTITLKSLAGVQQIKVADLKSRVNTGRSLMPEGFDGLGGETLRDIIAYMQSVDGGKYRTLDLRDAFTASTTTGLYHRQEAKGDSFEFLKTGTVKVGEVPFNIVSPEKAPRNIMVLKGGPPEGYAKTLPQRVEVKAGGFKANRLHFLGGVTGWGYTGQGEGGDVVLTATVHTTQGQREQIVCKNGVEFADYAREIDVPGSKLAPGLVKRHQLRWFTKVLSSPQEIDRITLESPDSAAAPTIVAITAELADPNAPESSAGLAARNPAPIQAGKPDLLFVPQFTDAVPQPPATKPEKGPRVLLVGGGSSHDFPKFFGEADKAILSPQVGWVDFTQNANAVPSVMANLDLLVWSANQPIASETAEALMDWVNAGKPLVLLHPGVWYLWKNFPEWNSVIAGGGARGHDKLGEYEVTVIADHPVTVGVTKSFRITDELYYYTPDPAGTPIEVLATATSTAKQPGTYPQVFLVKHPKAKIVGITLGHDERAHDLPEFQALLRNAVKWSTGH
jgi:putative membrane-bound dehydrogenase-like protein